MTNSRIGKQYIGKDLKNIPDDVILIEAAARRGQSISELIKPSSPSLSRIDLQKWKLAYMSAKNTESPNRNALYEVYDNIMIDNTLTSMIDTRILKVEQAKFKVLDKKNNPKDELTYIFERSWFNDFLRACMEARFEGFRLCEFFDFTEEGEIAKCTVINKYHVKPEKGIITKEAGDDKGWDYLNGKQALFYLPIGNKNDLGLLYKAAPHTLAKKFALGTWAEFNEKIGIPFRTVHTPINDKVRQQQLATIMRDMGSAGWAVLNENEKVELLAISGSDPTKCFDSFVGKMDAELAMLILGQTMTSNSQDNKGTYGSMKVLQEISNDRHEADLQYIKYIINNELIPRMITYGYKLNDCYFDWDKSEDMSIKETVDYVVQLSSVYDIPADFVTEKTGIPITGIKKIQAAAPPQKPTAVKKKSLVSIHQFYETPNCCDKHPIAAAKNNSDFDELVLNVAKKIYEGKQKSVVDIPLLKATAQELRQAIIQGYKTTEDKDFDVRDYEKLKHLQKNVYVFSGYKSYQELRDITDLLLDKKGNVKSFADFKSDVLELSGKYNTNYLNAEYNHAIVSSQMASQWLDIQKNKDVLPFLQFDATLDNRTTDVCRGLDGVTLPVDDVFWNTYYLPLHWNERSVIRQLARGVATNKETINAPELQPMFKSNVGKTGVAFPESHPYYEASKKDAKQIDEAVKKAMPKQLQETFSSVSRGNKKIQVSNFVSAEESIYNKQVAFTFAKEFDVKVLGTFKSAISPDLQLGNLIAEIKTPESESLYSGVKSAINNVMKQRYSQSKQGVSDALLIKAVIVDLKNYKKIDDNIIAGAINVVLNGKKRKLLDVFILHKGKYKKL